MIAADLRDVADATEEAPRQRDARPPAIFKGHVPHPQRLRPLRAATGVWPVRERDDTA